MESTERLQRRIGTLDELHTIVRTMKALSAASIRQYEQAARSLDDYYRTVELGLQVALRETGEIPVPSRRERTGHLAAIVFGSDHGLCGRFNEDITAHALKHLDHTPPDSDNRRFMAIGARTAAELEESDQAVEEIFLVPGSAARITSTVQQILGKIDEWRSEADVHHVYLFYNHHLDSGSYRPTAVQLLPVDPQRFRQTGERPWPSRRLPTFTMDRKRLLAALLRQYFFVSLFRACAESQASEHASRLAAMQSAEKNLEERLEEVATQFRRLRQQAITTELLDVVSGFEAVMTEPV